MSAKGLNVIDQLSVWGRGTQFQGKMSFTPNAICILHLQSEIKLLLSKPRYNHSEDRGQTNQVKREREITRGRLF